MLLCKLKLTEKTKNHHFKMNYYYDNNMRIMAWHFKNEIFSANNFLLTSKNSVCSILKCHRRKHRIRYIKLHELIYVDDGKRGTTIFMPSM